jgi:hypothetical protein
VGKKRTQFVIHKKLLCNTTDFFLKAFGGSFKESEGIMHLQDEHPGAFSLFVNWLYRSRISHVSTARHWVDLFNLYIFAEKLCLNELANRTIDRIRHMEACSSLDIVTIALTIHVYKKTFADSPLRQYCVEALAYDLSREAMEQHIPVDDRLKQIWEYSRDDCDFFVDYFRYLREHRGEDLETPAAVGVEVGDEYNSEMLNCRFHRHAKGEECYNGKSGFDISAWASQIDIEDIKNFSE